MLLSPVDVQCEYNLAKKIMSTATGCRFDANRTVLYAETHVSLVTYSNSPITDEDGNVVLCEPCTQVSSNPAAFSMVMHSAPGETDKVHFYAECEREVEWLEPDSSLG